jgi:hypothetical protein
VSGHAPGEDLLIAFEILEEDLRSQADNGNAVAVQLLQDPLIKAARAKLPQPVRPLN